MTYTPHIHPNPSTGRSRRRLALTVIASGLVSATAMTSLAAPTVGAAPIGFERTADANPTSGSVPVAAAAALRALTTPTTDPAEYHRLRDELAAVVAPLVGLDAVQLAAAWAAADAPHQRAMIAALTQVGVAYRRNSSRPGVSFDCSGLTTFAWASAGVALPRSSSQQIRFGARRDASTAQAGDLVYYPGHVMIWLGVGRAVVHSSDPRRGVEVRLSKRSSLRYADPTGN